MNIYFDTEFTGLVPDTDLISIGMVADNDLLFYAEFTDYDESKCDQWIRENVLSHLTFCGRENSRKYHPQKTGRYSQVMSGTTDQIVRELRQWLAQFAEHGERVQMIGDVSHYDMVLFCNLFGGAMHLPAGVNPVCFDICQCLPGHGGKTLAEQMDSAFNLSREDISPGVKGSAHDSLHDALVIRELYHRFVPR